MLLAVYLIVPVVSSLVVVSLVTAAPATVATVPVKVAPRATPLGAL